ncbi:hypothetical protein PHYSODRAFT_421546, partial [Phytophthora sojae]
ASARGDLKTVKWVVESYSLEEFLTEVVSRAAHKGDRQILTYLREHYSSNCYWRGVE